MRRILLASLLGLACALWSAEETAVVRLAGAQEAKLARVTELVHSQADSASQVLVRVEGTVTPRTERLDNPPRLALDLVGAVPAMKLGTLPLKDPRIRQIRSSLYRTDPSTVRVVFDLVAPTDFQVRAVEGGVLVVFGETTVATGPGPAPGPKAEAPKAPSRRLPSAAGPPPSAVRTPPPTAALPASPPQAAAAPAPQVAQTPQAPAPQPSTPTPAPPARRNQAKLISMDFKDADINNLLRILAEFSGVNIVSGEDVKAKVTVRLNNVPWDQALDAVVKGAKMAYVREGNIIRVDKLDNLSKEAEGQIKLEQAEEEFKSRQEERRIQIESQRKRAQIEIEGLQKKTDLENREREAKTREVEQKQAFNEAPLAEETIHLKNAHVGTRKVELISFFRDQVREEERKGVEEGVKPLLTSRGSVLIDERTNSLTMRDLPDNLERIKKFIETVDRPTPLIQVDARIVQINRSDALTLGVQWGGVFTPDTGRNNPVVNVQGTQGASSTSALNFPAGSPSNFPLAGGSLGLAVGVIASNFRLDAALQALEAEKKVQIISRPSVVTQENQPATVASGESIPIISVLVTGGAGQPQVSFKDVTTRIQVIPRTTPDKKIHLRVGLKKEDLIEILQAAGQLAPRTSKQEVVTNLLLEDGQTGVIGGLQVESKTQDERGIPFLKRIPILGWLFKNHLDEGQVQELMIFLTARIIEGPSKGAAPPPSGGAPPAIGAAPSSGETTGSAPPASPEGPAKAPAVALPNPIAPAAPLPDQGSWR